MLFRSNLGLETAGVEVGKGGEIKVDAYSRTTQDNIYAIGDVTDRLALTPVAIQEAMAFVDTVYRNTPRAMNHSDVPTAVFSTPPVSTVGLTEAAARAAGITYFDTAPLYGLGLSEERFGAAFKRWGRAGTILSTKIGRVLEDGDNGQKRIGAVMAQLHNQVAEIAAGKIAIADQQIRHGNVHVVVNVAKLIALANDLEPFADKGRGHALAKIHVLVHQQDIDRIEIQLVIHSGSNLNYMAGAGCDSGHTFILPP